MALHKDFPDSPQAILDPEIRGFPAQRNTKEFRRIKGLQLDDWF
jgi:hypothetical protein